MAGGIVLGLLVVGLACYGLPMFGRALSERRLDRLARARKMLVLTYDDGPGERLTSELLDLLDRAGVRASFFPLGRRALMAPDMLDRAAKAGHEIGCHSADHLHAWKVLPGRSLSDARQGYVQLARWVRAAGGLYRPPHGKLDLATAIWLKLRGARLAWWTLDSGDTDPVRPEPEAFVAQVIERGGGVVLFHDFDGTEERSRYVLETTRLLLETARTRGWRVTTLGECLDQEPTRRLLTDADGPRPGGVREQSGTGADGVICYAGVDWWYHNRGHSECQIMRRLASQVPVLWVNSIGMRMPTPGKSDLAFHRYVRKIKSTLNGLKQDDCGLWVYSPLFLPRYSKGALRLNGWLLNLQTRWLARKLGIRRPSVFITVPTAGPALAHRSWVKQVFNRSDVFSEFPEVDRNVIGALESELLRSSDEVLYVNRALMAAEQGKTRSSHYLDHGVDFDHFASVRTAEGASVGMPEEIADLPRPIVGFYGALDDYTIDLDLMIRVAKSIPSGSLLVIGPRAMEIQPLLDQPNVRYLGQIPYDELPRYAAHFDVGIMPWLQNDWIAGCNPIKLKEYLALGFPIVSMRFPELAPYEDLVHATDDRDAFARLIQLAMESDTPEAFRRRREFVRHSSWTALADRVGGMLELERGAGDD